MFKSKWFIASWKYQFILIAFLLSISLNVAHGKYMFQHLAIDAKSLALGGTGIVNPQSRLSALYLNPATIGLFDSSMGFEMSFDYSHQWHVYDGIPDNFQHFFSGSLGFAGKVSEMLNMGFLISMPYAEKRDIPDQLYINWEQYDLRPALSIDIDIFHIGISIPVTFHRFTTSTLGAYLSHVSVGGRVGVALRLEPIHIGAFYEEMAYKPEFKLTPNSNDIQKVSPFRELGVGIGLSLHDNRINVLTSWRMLFLDQINENLIPLDNNSHMHIIGFGIAIDPNFPISIQFGYSYSTNASNTYITPNHHLSLGSSIFILDRLILDIAIAYSLKKNSVSKNNNENSNAAVRASIGLRIHLPM